MRSGPSFLNCGIIRMNWWLCKLEHLSRDSESCQPVGQTAIIFRERNRVLPWWYNYSFLNHLSKLNCLFSFTSDCPFQLMGLEGSEHRRRGLSLGDSCPGTAHGKTEREGPLLSPLCSSFSVQAQLSCHSADAGGDRSSEEAEPNIWFGWLCCRCLIRTAVPGLLIILPQPSASCREHRAQQEPGGMALIHKSRQLAGEAETANTVPSGSREEGGSHQMDGEKW